jgi:choline monooxygenase
MTTIERPMTPPLSRAATLPARYYLDAEILEREKERVFGRTWQLVARTDELQRAGDFVPVTVLDEPIVITHGVDGALRAFYNVCRHRAGQVALTKGNRKSLQCRYHGWTYGLDGALRACPEMEATEDFRKEDFGLIPVRVERWGPFVFVNLSDDAPPLREVMGAIPAEVETAGYDVDAHAPGRASRLRHRVQLEGVRRQLPRGLPPADRPSAALQGARLRLLPRRGVPLLLEAARADPRAEGRRGARPRPPLPPHRRRRGGRPLLLALPEHDVQHLPGQHVLERDPADGPDRTLTIFEWFFAEPGSGPGWESMQQTIAFSDEIQQEDIVICEQVQRGLRSRAYDTGRFSAKRENGVVPLPDRPSRR